MTERDTEKALILDERVRLTLGEVCRSCGVSAEYVITLVHEGVIEPECSAPGTWTFPGPALARIRRAARLQSDLELNLAGAALAMELLDEVEGLRARVRTLERMLGGF